MTQVQNRTRDQLAALFNISRALNSTLEVQEVLQTMLDMGLDIFEADAGSVMLLREGYLKISVSRGLDPEIVAKTKQKIGSGIAGWVAKTGQPLRLDGKVEDPRFEKLVERGDSIASSLSIPVSVEGEMLGVLMIRRAGDKTFEDGDLAFLESVGDLAAVALQKARLFQAEREHRHQLELSHQQLSATLSSMADGVLVFDQAGKLLTHNSVAKRLLQPLLGQQLGKFAERFAHMLGPETTELNSGERLLKVVSTPLIVEDMESGSVLLFRDETASRELERMKSEFLSMVSHELKTPITTISAFLELLLHREFGKERQEHFLNICQQECGRLQSLIDQLLHLTRLEAGRFVLDIEKLDFAAIVRESLPSFAETSPIHEFELLEPLPEARLEGDGTLLTQAVINLFSNAVKYSPNGGTVKIGLVKTASTYVLSVSDEGVGIEAEKKQYVFEKFYRADNSLTRATGGTGLGLANVKHIILAHGGQVWVESEPGQGSTFFLELPNELGGQ